MKIIPYQKDVVEKIFPVRDQKVMMDVDLAKLYGVQTKVLIQAIKRNRERFPKDFMFQLSKKEFRNLRSQFVTSNWGGRRYLPYAFTEQGVAMLSSVLNSDRAINVNIGIMRVFVNIRKLVAADRETTNRLNQMEYNKKVHGVKTIAIFKVIHKPIDTKLIIPGKPFSNKKTIRDVINCSAPH